MDSKNLAKKIFEVSYLTGDFKLRSGQISTEYFDKYRFESQPEILQEIVEHLKLLIPPATDALAGLEMGGIPIATALSLTSQLPVAFIRKQTKDYGTKQFAEGLDIKQKNLLIVEDVITTGGQVLKSVEMLQKSGANVSDIMCVIFRGTQIDLEKLKSHNLNIHHLFTVNELRP